jgi:hypothetical protein
MDAAYCAAELSYWWHRNPGVVSNAIYIADHDMKNTAQEGTEELANNREGHKSGAVVEFASVLTWEM